MSVAPILGLPAGEALAALQFKVLPHAAGGATEIQYTMPDPTNSVDDLKCLVLRNLRRYPGFRRRGELPVEAQAEELLDGVEVFRSSDYAFDFEERREEIQETFRVVTTLQYRYDGIPRDRILVRQIRVTSWIEGDIESVVVTLFDRNELEQGEIHYYTAFVGATYIYSAHTQGTAVATGRGRFDLFRDIPALHQNTDTQLPYPDTVSLAELEKGQLQRFLDVFSAHSDMLSEEVAAIGHMHNPQRIDARLLPAMAHMLGWKLFNYTNEEDQRTEIEFSSHAYPSLGSQQTLADVINLLTGWETRVREFAADVLMSFDESRVDHVDGVQLYLDGHVNTLPNTPWLSGGSVPRGAVDTSDQDAMFLLRTHSADDTTAYTYDFGLRQLNGDYVRTNDTRYNKETIGVYIVPDVDTELFKLEQEWSRISSILSDFIPMQTRLVFTVLPGIDYEDARLNVQEQVTDIGIEQKTETYNGVGEVTADTIPGIHWLITNTVGDKSVDTSNVDLSARSVHIGLQQP